MPPRVPGGDQAGSCAPVSTCWFHVAGAKPFGTCSIVMQPETGQTIWQRLQPTHSDSSMTGTRLLPSQPAFVEAGWMHWCAPSWQAVMQRLQPMHLSGSIFATVS
jgi:hypothetical protein